ncbi:MAG: hypothetical protein HQM15_06515 [Deltaproteobacteria bacterium]|nr:hypothetical protein [Deltaproteobacteria bacterium]
MKDRNVEILLNTPLLIIADRNKIKEKPILENILRVGGKIIEKSSAGLQLTVKWVGSDRQVEKIPPFAEIFIPLHKIDHVLLG